MNRNDFYILFNAVILLAMAGLWIRDRRKKNATVSYDDFCAAIVRHSFAMKAFRIVGPNVDKVEPVRRSDIPEASWRNDFEIVAEGVNLSLDQMKEVRNAFPSDAPCYWDLRKSEKHSSVFTYGFAIRLSSRDGSLVAVFRSQCNKIQLVKESGAELGGVMVTPAQMDVWNDIYQGFWPCSG